MTTSDGDQASDLERAILASKDCAPGDANYRAYVGPPDQYDFMGATQFRLLTSLGLREDHRLLDIGCGSLRAGKYLLHYLMPGRYFGVEPATWLWKTALRTEIGQDVVQLKSPRFLSQSDNKFPEIADGVINYAVAQSIYSHCGADFLVHSLTEVAAKMAPRAQFLFTALCEDDPGYGALEIGTDLSGWIYPECVVYPAAALTDIAQECGLYVQKLAWYHPRQTWFRAVKTPEMLMSAEQEAQLGTGRPLFDGRFA